MDILKVSGIIDDLNPEFSSYEFIEKYASVYEEEYIEMLYAHKGKHAFQTTHSLMGRFLSENRKELGIEKSLKKDASINVFGNRTEVQYWMKADKIKTDSHR